MIGQGGGELAEVRRRMENLVPDGSVRELVRSLPVGAESLQLRADLLEAVVHAARSLSHRESVRASLGLTADLQHSGDEWTLRRQLLGRLTVEPELASGADVRQNPDEVSHAFVARVTLQSLNTISPVLTRRRSASP